MPRSARVWKSKCRECRLTGIVVANTLVGRASSLPGRESIPDLKKPSNVLARASYSSLSYTLEIIISYGSCPPSKRSLALTAFVIPIRIFFNTSSFCKLVYHFSANLFLHFSDVCQRKLKTNFVLYDLTYLKVYCKALKFYILNKEMIYNLKI